MRTYLHALLLLLIYVTSTVTTFRDQFDTNYKIRHGGQFPYVAYLESEGDDLRCGSSIIRDDIVLTAAHCVIGRDPSKMKIKAGGITTSGLAQTVNVRDFHVRYENTNKTDSCDIALVKLDGYLKFGEHVQYVELAKKDEVFNGQEAAALYWIASGHAKNLQNIPFEIMDSKNCSEITNTTSESRICGYDFSRAVRDYFKGTSGGPLILNANLNYMMHKQIGVICESEPLKSGSSFLSVSLIRSWIDAVLGSIYEIESSSEEAEDNFIKICVK